MTTQLKNKIDACLSLLTYSPLDPEIKQALSTNLDKMPEAIVDELIDSLDKEQLELDQIARKIKAFEEEQVENWAALEAKQQETANQIVQELTREVSADILNSIRNDLK